MKFLWILVGLALTIDATHSVPVEMETIEGDTYTDHTHTYKYSSLAKEGPLWIVCPSP